jgi:hypothetical protein
MRYELWCRRQWRIVGFATVMLSGASALAVVFVLLHTLTAK